MFPKAWYLNVIWVCFYSVTYRCWKASGGRQGRMQHCLWRQLVPVSITHWMGGPSLSLHRRLPYCHTVQHHSLLSWAPKLKYHNPPKRHSSEKTTSFTSSLYVDLVRCSPEDENLFWDPLRWKGLTIHTITSKGFQMTGYVTDLAVQIYCAALPDSSLRSQVFWACSCLTLENRDYILTYF